jgi:hypothetical protein
MLGKLLHGGERLFTKSALLETSDLQSHAMRRPEVLQETALCLQATTALGTSNFLDRPADAVGLPLVLGEKVLPAKRRPALAAYEVLLLPMNSVHVKFKLPAALHEFRADVTSNS